MKFLLILYYELHKLWKLSYNCDGSTYGQNIRVSARRLKIVTAELIQVLWVILVVSVSCAVLCPILLWILPDRTQSA